VNPVPAPFEYERATSVEDAIGLLERLGSEARLIAGGHSLLPMMKLRLGGAFVVNALLAFAILKGGRSGRQSQRRLVC
jgi:hypothetical protein